MIKHGYKVKVTVVTIYRSYFFGLFKREIKIPYQVIDGKGVFEYPPKKKDQVIITYKYEEK